jgi:hypothetical protein
MEVMKAMDGVKMNEMDGCMCGAARGELDFFWCKRTPGLLLLKGRPWRVPVTVQKGRPCVQFRIKLSIPSHEAMRHTIIPEVSLPNDLLKFDRPCYICNGDRRRTALN